MKITIKEASKLIKNLIWVFCISLVAFYFIKIPIEIYKIILLLIWIYMILEYKLIKNLELYINLSVYSIVNIISFYISNLIGGKEIKSFKVNELKIEVLESNIIQYNEISKIIIVLSIFVISFFVCKFIKQKIYDKKNNKIKEEKELFEERKGDLKRLGKYLKDFNIVGIDGDWGSGKSFLTDHLEGYIKIKIDLLACNEDDIQIVVLNELDKLLKNQRIFSSYSPKLKKILRKERFFENIGDVLVNDDTLYSDVLTGLAKDLDKIDGTILIIYEDLDRVEDTNVIKKILGISEKISSSKVKILHQFSGKNIEEKGINRDYLEKYIPFILNITEIPFYSIIKYVLKEEKYKDYPIKKEEFKLLDFNDRTILIYSYLGEEGSLRYKYKNISIRRIEHFLDELNIIIREKEKYFQNKEIVITFFFMKHFMENLYKKIIPGKSLIDTFLYKYDNKEDTLINWLKLYKKGKINIMEGLKDKDNEEVIFIFSLLRYRFYYEEDNQESVIEDKIINNEKDRIIWSLINSGKSEYTDYENAANRFMNEVINVPKNEQINNYKKLLRDFYLGEANKDNRSIFMIGENPMLCLFRAISIAGIESENWKNIVEFCFEYYDIEEINLAVIKALKYCDLTDRETYLYIISRFNKLKIIGNLNEEEDYSEFLNKYFKQIIYLKFEYIYYEDILIRDEQCKIRDIKELNNNIFEPMKNKLQDTYKKVNLEKAQNDIDIIINFINHNIELIKNENTYEEGAKVKFELKESREIKKQMSYKDEIKGIKDHKKFNQKLEKGYKEGKLSLIDLKELKENR